LIPFVGFLGKLSVKIPWANWGSQPAVIRIEKIFLIIAAKNVSEVTLFLVFWSKYSVLSAELPQYDEVQEQKQSLFTKRQRLLLMELMKGDNKVPPTTEHGETQFPFIRHLEFV
jgi:hypothetical protein